MAYLIALLGAIIFILILVGFVRAYDRHLKDCPGPWIMDEVHLND
jgi:hypothetical protein